MPDEQSSSDLEAFQAGFHAEIKRHQRRFLIECAKVFFAFGAILVTTWLLTQWMQTPILFDLHPALRSQQTHAAFSSDSIPLASGWVSSSVNLIASPDYSPYRRVWHHSDGFRLELRSCYWKRRRQSDSAEQEKTSENLAALPLRVKRLSDSLQSTLESSYSPPSKPDSSSDSIVKFSNSEALTLATERHHPNGTSTIWMESGNFVVELFSPHRMGYRDALSLLDRDHFLFERVGLGTFRGWVRLHHLPVLLSFVLACCILWMWQIISSPRRFAGIAPHLPASALESVQSGLRTLADLSPAVRLEQRSNRVWSIHFLGYTEAVSLTAPEITSASKEWRIRFDSTSTKAKVREVERLRSRQKGIFSWFGQSEISFSVPMLQIPDSPFPFRISKEGFELLSSEMDESHLRFALAYYFYLHGWGWEPRLF